MGIALETLDFPNYSSENSLLLNYFKIIRAKKWLIFLCSLVITILFAVWTFMTVPVYEAETLIMYEEPNDTMFALDIGQPFYNKSATLNLIEVIKSYRLAERVVESLPPEVISSYNLSENASSDGSTKQIIATILRKNLSVEGIRGSDVIVIRVSASSPLAAQVVANTYAEQVLDWNLRKKRMEISNIRSFIENQLKVFQEKLDIAEDALKEFKEKNKIISLSDVSTEILNRLTAAETAYNQTKAEREAQEQRKIMLEQKKQEVAPSLTVVSNPLTQELKQKILSLEQRNSNLKVQNKPENQTEILSLQEQIESLKQQLVQELLSPTLRKNLIDPLSQIRTLLQESISLDVDIETAKVREQALNKIIDEYNGELQTLPKHELALARLIRDREVNNQIYTTLLEKREEAKITEAGKLGDVHIIDPAEKPRNPIKPNKRKNLISGLILGIGFGIGLAIFLDSLDFSLKSQDDIEKKVNLPVLASIPSIEQNGEFHLLKRRHHKKLYYAGKLLSQNLEIPHLYESYQTFALNFAFINAEKKYKTLLVTSPGAGAGKTLTAINIAQLYAKNGAKILLIDCDLRRPMLHKILELPQKPGLSDLLIEKAKMDETIHHEVNNGIYFITAGTSPPNPSDLLNTRRMENLLNEAKSSYDFIILDSPPLIAVTDPLILGTKSDGTLIVIRSGSTKQDAAKRAKDILEKNRIPILGVILNDVNFKNVYGYYKDYYYYSNSQKSNI